MAPFVIMLELFLQINLAARQLCVVDNVNKSVVECFEAAIGRPGCESPVGDFNITRIIEMPQYINQEGVNVGTGILGDMALLTDQKTCDGLTFAIHGTNAPHLIGEEVSKGCIRLTNYDINKLNLLYLDNIFSGRVY